MLILLFLSYYAKPNPYPVFNACAVALSGYRFSMILNTVLFTVLLCLIVVKDAVKVHIFFFSPAFSFIFIVLRTSYYILNAIPMIYSSGTGPLYRESSEFTTLSPAIK